MKSFIVVFLFLAADIFVLDAVFTKIVNTATADIKTKTTLSSLKGHVAVNVSPGNSDLDKQLAAGILETFPNFTSESGEVNNKDLYQMSVRVFRNSDNTITVTDHQDKKTVDRRVPTGTADNKVLTTIQYKNAVRARNEFDTYPDSAFADVGPPQNANYTPKEPYDWSWLTNFFVRFSFSNIAAGFKPKEWEGYLGSLDYFFTNSRLGLDMLSFGLIFDNDIGISVSLFRLDVLLDDSEVGGCAFPIDISWNFLKIWGFRFAAYDRFELLSWIPKTEKDEYGRETKNAEWAPNNYIGLRLQWGLSVDNYWGGLVLGVFTETDFKTFSLGISAGLGWQYKVRDESF